jgi:hypothetical protein
MNLEIDGCDLSLGCLRGIGTDVDSPKTDWELISRRVVWIPINNMSSRDAVLRGDEMLARS